jgi:cell division protein FtsB
MARYITKIAILLILISIIVQQGVSMFELLGRQKRITDQKMEVLRLRNERTELQRKRQEVDTPEFIEREARTKLGMGKPGETVLIMPENGNIQEPVERLPDDYLPNWERWVKLFF